MRICTFNIRGCLGNDGRRLPARIATVLRDIGADIICLQEVHQRLPESQFQDQPRRLSRALGFHLAFQCNLRLGIGRYGNAVLSRWPIIRCGGTELPNSRERASILRMPERRGLLEVVIERPDGAITIMNSHWSLSPDDRLEAARLVAQRVGSVLSPLLLTGDFNATPESPEIVLLLRETRLSDSGSLDSRPTFPSNAPASRIDLIMAGEGVRVEEYRIVETGASDHVPVVVDVSFSHPATEYST